MMIMLLNTNIAILTMIGSIRFLNLANFAKTLFKIKIKKKKKKKKIKKNYCNFIKNFFSFKN